MDFFLSHAFNFSERPFCEWAFSRFLLHEQVEAVLAEFGPTGVGVMNACALAKIPLVVHFHGFDAYKNEVLENYHHSYQKMFGIASALVASSKDMREQLVFLGAPREKIFLNSYGVDLNFFKGADPVSAPPTFLAVGRFVEKKAPYLTLVAFKEVVEKYPKARLTFVGDGPLMDVCKNLSKALGLSNSVNYLGVCSPLEVVEQMRQVRGFVQHSIQDWSGDSEGTPVAVLEAGAMGLPVVSTNHCGIKEAVLDKKTGYLVEEGDVKGMAGRMIELIKYPHLAGRLGQSARQHIGANYSIGKSLASLADIIEHAIAHKQP